MIHESLACSSPRQTHTIDAVFNCIAIQLLAISKRRRKICQVVCNLTRNMQSAGLGVPQAFEQTENLGSPDNALNNNFQDIEAFLERVLVQNPVSIDADLVPSVLSRGLGLNSDSSSLGQQGSNDRRVNSGKLWSSVSNDAQGVTGNNNNTTTNNGLPILRTASDKGKMFCGKRNHDDTNVKASVRNTAPENKNVSMEQRNNQGAAKKPQSLIPDGRWADAPQKTEDTMRGTSKKRVHAHRNKNQKQMRWNQDLQQQLTRQQMQQQMQQMQQQQMQQQLQQMQQHQYNPAGASPPFGLIPPPGYLFPSQQQPFPPVPYPYQMTAPDGRRVGVYPGMDQVPGNQAPEDHTTKRSRLIWTDKLHQRFLEAVDRCGGIDHALPKAIMKDMKVEGLTRENVSSHLQKYRLRLKKSAEDNEGEYIIRQESASLVDDDDDDKAKEANDIS